MLDRRLRVLVIDDDPSVREVVRSLLVHFGYDCETAADGQKGVARFDEGEWDLVLTDLVMPNMNGWEVATAIRQRSSTVPIVLITALVDAEVMEHAAERGVPVVSKPFRAEHLRTTVASALQLRLATTPSPSGSGSRSSTGTHQPVALNLSADFPISRETTHNLDEPNRREAPTVAADSAQLGGP
jgi:CheY-like chemotaxis protein